MQEILSITRDVIDLIKAQQIEAAERLVTQAFRRLEEKGGDARSEAILQINIKLQQIKEQRKILRQTLQALPEKERIFAEVQIEEVVDRIFTYEIAVLKERKRALSRPGGT